MTARSDLRRSVADVLDQMPAWLNSHHRRTVVGAFVILVALLGLNVTSIFMPGRLPDEIMAQADLTGMENTAAMFAALVGFVAAAIAVLGGARSAGYDRVRWALLSASCAAITLIDLLLDHPGGRVVIMAAVSLAVVLISSLRRHLRGSGRGLALILLLIVVAILNPVLDRNEKATFGNPDNYRLVSSDEPYQMTSSAWKRLALVQQAQEASETLLLMLMAELFLLDIRTAEGRRASEPALDEPVPKHETV